MKGGRDWKICRRLLGRQQGRRGEAGRGRGPKWGAVWDSTGEAGAGAPDSHHTKARGTLVCDVTLGVFPGDFRPGATGKNRARYATHSPFLLLAEPKQARALVSSGGNSRRPSAWPWAPSFQEQDAQRHFRAT